ncbi:MAG: flagellar basal body-associated FliL family protein [Halieaceae bacterium]
MKKIILILGLLLLVGAGGAGAFFYMGEKAAPAEGEPVAEVVEEETAPIFVKLDPPLVVNFTHRGNLRYLQTTLEVMHRDQEVVDDISLNMPVIRNNLILVLSDQSFEDLNTKSAKEDLRVKISETIAQTVPAQPPVEVFITSFVMQ